MCHTKADSDCSIVCSGRLFILFKSVAKVEKTHQRWHYLIIFSWSFGVLLTILSLKRVFINISAKQVFRYKTVIFSEKYYAIRIPFGIGIDFVFNAMTELPSFDWGLVCLEQALFLQCISIEHTSESRLWCQLLIVSNCSIVCSGWLVLLFKSVAKV